MPKLYRGLAALIVCLSLVFNIAAPLPVAEAGTLISTKDEISIGQRAARELEQKYGLVDDAALQERVARIGAAIAAVSDRKDITYSFKVLNSKDINALALPGGYVYVFKGLTDYMPSDDELAGILGHEVGHVVKRHSVKQMEKSLTATLLFGLVFGDRGLLLQNLAQNVIMAGYSRADESEADYLGFVHSNRAGFNPYSMLIGLKKLADLDHKGDYSIFASHPEPESRVAMVKGYIDKAKIRPQVVEQAKSAQIVDGDWSLPPLYATYENYKPVYRAYFAAGVLSQLAATPDFSGDRFVLDNDGTFVTIYYDDRKVITLTPQDAASNNMTIDDLTSSYITALKQWAAKRQQVKP